MVTSENAKQVVAFLEALESDNIDLIKEVHSVSQLGWQMMNISYRVIMANSA